MAENYLGYVRVASAGQSIEEQKELLSREGCTTIFEEKLTDNQQERLALSSLLETVQKGDVVVAGKLDRLARSMVDFSNIVAQIQEKGASLKILNMGLDSRTDQGQAMIAVLSHVADFEQELVKERQADGIAKAKKAGKHLGRPAVADETKQKVLQLLSERKTKNEISEMLDIGISTIYKIQRENS